MRNFKKYWKHVTIGIICGILNGLFGAGGGSVAVIAMEKFLNIEAKKAHATAIGIVLIMSLVSSFVYFQNGFFNFNIWWTVTLGGIFGGIIGAKVLVRLKNANLKIIFGVALIATAIKMVI
ncbi:MAG: sulfite exporter TauE/SafE family protein [Oscillospiraceae bacterium]